MASYLKSVPAAPSWLPKPRSGKSFKITLWFDPATYFLLMQQSAEMAAGEISITKWFKKQLHLNDAAKKVTEVDGRTAVPVTLAIAHRNHQIQRQEKNKVAAAARRPRQARKVAA